MTPAKKRILHKIKIHEISAVDAPAQEHARMIIMKRADDTEIVPPPRRFHAPHLIMI